MVRHGYANFAVADPPLKLVLIEHADDRDNGVVGALNHLGVEVGDAADVSAASDRLAGEASTPSTNSASRAASPSRTRSG